MIKPRVFLCNGAPNSGIPQSWKGAKRLRLSTYGSSQNVNIRLEDVARAFDTQISPRLLDLIEIASLIYAADTATSRGEGWEEDGGVESWGRKLFFVIPVRDVSFWRETEVIQRLVELIRFMSNDESTFKFVSSKRHTPQQGYLDFGHAHDWPFYKPDRVIMFSGGLDSLSGAVETLKEGGKTVLVSHRPVGKIDSRQKRLVAVLKERFPGQIIHIPVCINKDKDLGREHTQRTRSFLYSSIGCVVVKALDAKGVRFFENGTVSLNLPVADEVLQARASRTTHPLSLRMIESLLSMVLERELAVDNPYIFLTKSEVVQRLSQNGHGDLIGLSSSCAHTWHQTKTQWHCGRCSQCIDRRIAVIAAGEEAHDLEVDYVADVFTGKREESEERNMAVDYVRHGLELAQTTETQIASKFNLELVRAARAFENQRDAMEGFVQLHMRHGDAVKRVLERKFSEHAGEIIEGRLEKTSMLAMVAGQKHHEPNWRRFCQRIAEVLRKGLPTAVQTHKPQDEPHLQEICDGILKGHHNDLIREFPFMRWSSSLTKPDWSSASHNLWVEAKYVRKRYGVAHITDHIAADITKYGDQQLRVLFVIYDPERVVTDEDGFSAPLLTRSNMVMEFVR
jgi:hypothetical protein